MCVENFIEVAFLGEICLSYAEFCKVTDLIYVNQMSILL